jgi:hypothetical protein
MFKVALSTALKMCLDAVRHVVFGTAQKCASMQQMLQLNIHDDDDDNDDDA